MSTIQYLKNRENINRIKEDNKNIIESIKEEKISKCIFKIGDIIKGQELVYSSKRVRVIEIQDFDIAFDSKKNDFVFFARGVKLNLDGSRNSYRNNIAAITIDKYTKLLK